MSEGLEGKIALVTGAGRGIGLATAKRLRGLGALVVAGLEEESQREAVRDFDPVVLNVLHEEHWAAAVGHCKDAHGGIDVLVNNAGILREGTAEETTLDIWEEVLAVNLRGVFLGCKHVIPVMRERGGGAIVNLASIDGLHGNHRHVAYAASKGGVVSITRALAMDHAPENIRVNSVCPGTVRTQMVMENMAGYNEQTVKEKHPLGREAEPEEVANVIAFLCGPGASFMTGMAVPVDGGRSIR
jgi:NAD(P)-dependent dehydrogenase (short-subunit alcohol dehydrogenase family)